MDFSILKQKKIFILDMDGTFYLGDQILEGSLDFIKHIREKGMDFFFFTNNSSKSPEVYVEKLARMGLRVTKDKIITSGMVTIDYIKKRFKNPRIYLVGTKPLEEDFEQNGIKLVETEPQAVVIGFDTTLTYDKIMKACHFIRQGVPFIATHPDLNCPTENGSVPDCGAMCAMITASTGVRPIYLGKPYPETIQYIMDTLKCKKEDMVFVGDRLNTDIAIGVKNGVTTILVLTGEATLADVEKSEIKPDFIVERLAELIKLI